MDLLQHAIKQGRTLFVLMEFLQARPSLDISSLVTKVVMILSRFLARKVAYYQLPRGPEPLAWTG